MPKLRTRNHGGQMRPRLAAPLDRFTPPAPKARPESFADVLAQGWSTRRLAERFRMTLSDARRRRAALETS